MSRHAPTISALTNIQDVAKNKVTNEMFLVCDMVPSSNEADIREAIARLKSSNREYGDASRAVSRWYLNKGSIQLSNESRRDRLILHQDVDESVQILNAKLVELGVEVESNLGNISRVASVTGQSTNSNVAVSRCVNPAASEIGQANANQIQLDAVVCDGSINESVDLGPPVERLSIVAPSVVPSGAGNIQAQVPSSVAHVSSSATFHQANDYHISEMGMNNVQRLFQTNGPLNNRAPPAVTMNTAFEDRRYGREDFPSCLQFSQLPQEPTSRFHHSAYVPQNNTRYVPHQNNQHPQPSQVHFSSQNNPTSFPLENQHSNEGIFNATARQLLKLEMMKGLNDPFDGSSHKFWSWYGYINSRIIESGIGPLDTIHVLKANTKGAPKKLISNYIDAGVINPGRVLEEIWSTFKRRYGSNEQVFDNLREQLRKINAISDDDVDMMEELYGLCMIIGANAEKCDSLKYYFLPEGMKEIWRKMPAAFNKSWESFYCATQETGSTPTFTDLLNKILRFINKKSHPMFKKDIPVPLKRPKVLATDIKYSDRANVTKSKVFCSLHDVDTHSLTSCKTFKDLAHDERKQHAYEKKLCFRCLGHHSANQCTSKQKCNSCKGSHITLMHQDRPVTSNNSTNDRTDHYKKFSSKETTRPQTLCTSVCKNGVSKICSKTVPVELRTVGNAYSVSCLAIIDEQSNNTFVDERIIKMLNISPSLVKSNEYVLTTLEQLKSTIQGSIIDGLEVKGVQKKNWIELPPALTHPGLPDTRSETSDSSIVSKHQHVKRLAKYFPDIDPNLEVMLLVGTNCGDAMRTRSYGKTYPFVHDTALGFALVGPSCLNTSADSSSPRVMRSAVQDCEHFVTSPSIHVPKPLEPSGQDNVFIERPDDEFPGLSKDQEEFLRKVSGGINVNQDYYIEIPLVFKRNAFLPDNRVAVFKRTNNTLMRISRDPVKSVKCTDIMKKYLAAGHVTELPEDHSHETKPNFIPIFLTENEKTGKSRIVFDSSAKYQGVSLNDCLLQGPDETNRLVGVLIRFRLEEVAVSADIECMFHSFYVPPDQRDYQCFFWWKDNDPNKKLVVFRANVHVFGHTSIPSVATYGLRYTTKSAAASIHPEACEFIMDNFYVDDGLRSEKTPSDAISTLKKTREILSHYNIRLHKIASSNSSVLTAFPSSEIATNINSVNLQESLAQRALGITWEIDRDEFQLKCHIKKTEFTKRSVLSVNGSLFDPLGIASPVGLTGKILQRKIFLSTPDTQASSKRDYWDEPLPEDHKREWSSWISQLESVSCVKLPRCYHPPGFGDIVLNEIHVFCDASMDSIAHVMYLRQMDDHQNIAVSFLFASSKIAPRAAVTIPRLELCAAVGAAQSAQYVCAELKKEVDLIQFYSDSKIVLGYINNRTRCFSRYVTSRIQSILSVSSPNQWKYVSTDTNPADIGTRPHTPKQLVATRWLVGPEFLQSVNPEVEEFVDTNIELPGTLKEVNVLCSIDDHSNDTLSYLLKFSQWKKMCSVVTYVLIFKAKLMKQDLSEDRARKLAMNYIVRETQKSAFSTVYSRLVNGRELSKGMADKSVKDIVPLDPYLDEDGLMRVGGRLYHGDLPYKEKHPVILPHSHHVTTVILRHYHQLCNHQGRHITTATMRQHGLHIHRPRSTISSFLKSCVVCKKSRGKLQTQKMAELPPDRLEKAAPFEKVGMDVFGPYSTHDGKSTRKTCATKKVWVLLFTCLYSRAVHLESLSSLDTTTFMMAFRRFVAIRGKCTLIRSDHGTNFMGARNQLQGGVDVNQLMEGMRSEGCAWELIPLINLGVTPHASHFAGVWERKVGSVKKVFNAAIIQAKNTSLSRC